MCYASYIDSVYSPLSVCLVAALFLHVKWPAQRSRQLIPLKASSWQRHQSRLLVSTSWFREREQPLTIAVGVISVNKHA